ncbi:MAG: hypothetical protein JNL79_38410 [Myxococcales bacterium]|nr:hypothetical protein [Myxococcales bacterium]
MKESLVVRALTLTFAIGAGAYLVVHGSTGCSKTTTATPEAPATTHAASAPASAPASSAPAASVANPPPTFMPATKSGGVYHPAPQQQKAP